MTDSLQAVFNSNSKMTKKVFLLALIFAFVFTSLLALIPTQVHAAAPTLTIGSWKDGQTKLVIIFDQPVHDGAGTPAALTTADFTVAGANAISISSIAHNVGSTMATLTLSGALNSVASDFTITCAATSIYNYASEACSPSAVNVYGGAEDTVGPEVEEVSVVGPGYIFVRFTETLTAATVLTGNFTLTTSDVEDDSTITSIQALDNGAVIGASGATMATGAGNTLAVGTGVQDAVGNASDGETVTILPILRISEVQTGASANTKDEFVELFNPSDSSLSLAGLFMHITDEDGVADTSFTLPSDTVPAHGYYLIATSFYSGSIAADHTYSTGTTQLATNSAVYISASATANTSVIDTVGWGTSATKEITALAAIVAGTSVERKASEGSTAAKMASGGVDASNGNSHDTQMNLNDFVVQATPAPQNSQSLPEFPFGADFNEGGGDTVAPTVTDSYPSASSASFIPANLSVAGISFSEQMDGSTITTSTVKVTADSDPGTNLCTTVTYNPNATFGAAVNCNIPAGSLPLAAAAHTLTVTTGVTDFAGNPLASSYTVAFTPSAAVSFSSNQVPTVVGSFPAKGSVSFPPNADFLNVNFSTGMNTSSFTNKVTLTNTTTSAAVTIDALTFNSIVKTNDSLKVDITDATLTAGNNYSLVINSAVTSSDSVALGTSYTLNFTTASSNDSTGPVVNSVFPANSATGVPVGNTLITISVDDALNSASVTTSTVKLLQGSDEMPITVSYNPDHRVIEIKTAAALEASTAYTVKLGAAGSGAAIANVSGVDLQDTDGSSNTYYQSSFTTGSADSTAPTVLFAAATQNGISVTFSEMMKESTVTNLSNWTLASPIGTALPLSSLSGNSVSWDAGTMTAEISGVSLTAGATFQITAGTGLKDLSSNPLASSSTVGGTVMDVGLVGSVGPDSGFNGNTFDNPVGFSSDSFGFVPQAGVMPMTPMAGATSNYMVGFPITEQIRSSANSGKVVLTFPSGFDVTNAVAGTDNPANSDANMQGPGTVAVDNVTVSAGSRTVTVDFTIATRCGTGNVDPCVSGSEKDMIGFNLSGIVNSTVPRSWETSGYTVDIKTLTGTTLLETMTSMPFFITAAGSNSLVATLTAAGANSGTVNVSMWCPSTGEQKVTSTAFSSGSATATFSGLPTDYCSIWTDPILTVVGADDFTGINNEPIYISGSDTKTYALGATSGLQSVTVQVTGAANKDVDVFASGPNGFTVKRIASTTSGTDSVTLKLADGDWFIGVGPHMSRESGSSFTAPDYGISPRDIPVTVANPSVTEASGTANDGTVTFAITTATATVPITVVDTSGNVIVGAMVGMDSINGGYGTFGETDTNGQVTLNVNDGTYRTMAFLHGTPPTGDVQVKVSGGLIYARGSSTASASVTLELSKGGNAITGTVTDGTNPVAGAPVFAHCTANCAGYFDAGTVTGTNGNYTLYVNNGTWDVRSHVPGWGETSASTQVVSGADIEDVDLRPDSGTTFRTITGTICKVSGGAADCTAGGAVGLENIELFVYSNAAGGGSNHTKTNSAGVYSVRVPSASAYVVDAFDPRQGPLGRNTGNDASGGNLSSIDIVIDTPESVTVNIKDSGGNLVTVNDMRVEFFDDTTELRYGAFIENASSKTMSIPEGTYNVFVHTMATPLEETTAVQSDDAGTAVTAGVVTVDGTEIVKIVLPTLNTVSANLTNGSSNIEGAWIEIYNATTGLMTGSATDSSGNASIKVADGTYQVNAYSPGIIIQPVTLTVDGNETLNLVGAAAGSSISGTVTDTNGAGVAYAFVKAVKKGGGNVVAQTDADGQYEIWVEDGTWDVNAKGYGYAAKALTSSVEISGSSSSSNNIQFTSATTGLATPKAQAFTPSQGGNFKKTELGLTVNIPKNALSTSTSAGSVTMKETDNVLSTNSTTVHGNGFELNAVDSNGTALTNNFTESVTVDREVALATLATSGIDTEAEVDQLRISYFGSNGSWQPTTTNLTYLDASGDVVADPASDLSDVTTVRFSTSVDHFTVFAITASADGLAPSAPTNVTAATDRTNIIISWDAVTTNTDTTAIDDLLGYEVYRDTSSGGSFTTQVNTSDVLTTTFTDGTASGGTTYYYKVTAADTGGTESAKSSASSAITALNIISGGVAYTPPSTPAAATTSEDDTVVVADDVADATSTDPVKKHYPTKAKARAKIPATVDIGNLVKVPGNATVYFIGGDGERHPFPNEATYSSWFSGFDSVKTITLNELASIKLSDPVRMRPGTWMIKITSDPKTYIVEPGGILRWIETEEVAQGLFGANWNQRIRDVDASYFVKYTVGAPVLTATKHTVGSVVRSGENVYYVAENGKLRKFKDEDAVRANGIQTRFERPALTTDLAVTEGDVVTSEEDVLYTYQDIGR